MKRFLLGLICLLYLSVYAEAASRFAVCTTACTWDGSSTLMWSATSGGATGASVPGSSDTVTLDASTCVGGVTCTITVNTTVTVQSITMGACTASTTGCVLDFSANNNNVTLTANTGFSGTGTGTRTVNLGGGLWTLSATANATIWNMTTTTNLTFNANGSTISLTGNAASSTSRGFTGGSLTYNNLSVGAASSGGIVAITGANTFADIAMTGPTQLSLPGGTTTTVTSLSITGASGSPCFLTSNSFSQNATLSDASGTDTLTWAGIRGITFQGGATFAATSSFDLGGNSGITITAPTTGGGGVIIGGWVLRRDLGAANDNAPAWLNLAA